jgi:imidazolonepropionase-like amidohydrolase
MPGGPLSHSEVEGVAAIADSPDEVRLRTREQLRQGASQIKLMAGGGVASPYNPIESTQYTEPEICAAVEAADNWGTYVTVHAYTPRAIRQAVAAGVKCIEHGQLIDEPTAQLLAEKGIWRPSRKMNTLWQPSTRFPARRRSRCSPERKMPTG